MIINLLNRLNYIDYIIKAVKFLKNFNINVPYFKKMTSTVSKLQSPQNALSPPP